MSPRVSLIATFYNAEAYLDRCVRSLLSQTHGDYEVILVDDGSADGTLSGLRRYERGESVRCFTKENGGAGSARNFGVGEARGDYLSFVDGDDFVSPYYLEALDSALGEHGCMLAAGAHIVSGRSSACEVSWEEPRRSRLVPAEEAVDMLAYEQLTESPWCKLAPRALYEEFPFPERWYEDVAVAGWHYLTAGDVALVETPLYAYVMTPGSVVNRRRASIGQLEDFVWSIDEFLVPLEGCYPQLESAIAFRRALECARAHSLAVRVADDCRRARELDGDLIAMVRSSLRAMGGDGRVPRAQRARFALLARAPRLYDAAFAAYELLAKGGVRA